MTASAWTVGEALGPRARRSVRRVTDPLVGPLGSVRGARTSDAVALTFDDGPGPATRPLLDVLEHHGATATFFVLVDRAEADPGAVAELVRRGHEVALHGLDHRRLTGLPPGAIAPHLAEGKRRLEALAGRPVRFTRPPFGSQGVAAVRAARRCGLEVVVWSADAEDWVDDAPAAIAARGAERLVPGGILLLHDDWCPDPADPAPGPAPTFDRAATADALLARLGARGLAAVSVGALLDRGRRQRTAWFRP